MNKNRTNHHYTELLAPAGNLEAFYGAIKAGADAVYLAGNRFGARAYAENFNTEELVKCICYAHLLGRKVYLTVNTLFKESEIAELYQYLHPFYEAGLDAVIVQDLGVFRFVHEYFPALELHVSTQMTICSGYDAALLKSMGASRVVPARELSLQEIIRMKQKANVEVETFIHGAMCYCYSGQCLFSSILGGRSGNRGRCAQPCRLPYTVKAGNVVKKDCYPLSLKDMCTMEYIPQLIEAEIDSFKIEGRMKKPEYAAGVTDVYRRAMDSYYELREKKGKEEAASCYKIPKQDMHTLRSLYMRSDIQDGYYFKHNGAEMVTMTNPAYSGSDELLLHKIRDKFLDSVVRLPITIMAEFRLNNPASVTFICGETVAYVKGDVVLPAQKQPITEDNLIKQLNKLGDSAFVAENIEVSLSENAFYPLKQINELRRMALEKLEKELLADCAKEIVDNTTDQKKDKRVEIKEPQASIDKAGIAILVTTHGQLMAFATWFENNKKYMDGSRPVSRIYVEGDVLLEDKEFAYRLCEKLAESTEIWVALPYIFRCADDKYLMELTQMQKECNWVSGFLVRNMGELGFLKESGSFRIRSDAGVYTWNHCAMEELSDVVEGFCLPYELNSHEQRECIGSYSCEKIIYGRIPMMITANCVMQTGDKCKKYSKDRISLTDRYHVEFEVVRNCRYCYNMIYNSVPLSLHTRLGEWKKKAIDLRMNFTYESETEMLQIIEAMLFDKEFPVKNYTTGHEKRGVE